MPIPTPGPSVVPTPPPSKGDRRQAILDRREINRKKEKGNKEKFKRIALLGNLIFFLIVLSLSLWSLVVGSLFLTLQVVYNMASLKRLEVEEIGLVSFFGRPLFIVESGLHYVPFGICELIAVKRSQHQFQVPPDDAWRGDVDAMPAGKKPALRINHPELTLQGYKRFTLGIFSEEELLEIPEPEQTEERVRQGRILASFGIDKASQDKEILEAYNEAKVGPLQRTQTSEPVVVITYEVLDPWSLFEEMEGSFENVDKQIEDLVVSFLGEEFVKRTLLQTQASLRPLSRFLEDRVDRYVFSWGLDSKITLKPIGLSHNLNIALQAVPEAEARAQATIKTATGEARAVEIAAEAQKKKLETEAAGQKNANVLLAEAEKQKRELEGQGDASAIKAKLDAETEALVTRGKNLTNTKNGQIVLAAEVAKKVSEGAKATYILGADGLTQAVGGLATAAINALNKKPTDGGEK